MNYNNYKSTVESHELALYAENTRELYERNITPTCERIAYYINKGTYNEERAVTAFSRIADEAAKLYTKEFGAPSEHYYSIFSKADRKAAAAEMLEYYGDYISELADKTKLDRMSVGKLINEHNKHNPGSHFFDDATLRFFGESRSKMKVLTEPAFITDYDGEHKCYILSSYQSKAPGGGRTAHHYFDVNTFAEITPAK